MNRSFWSMLIRFFIALIVIIGICAAIYFIFPLVLPFLIGTLLALMFNPFVNFMERKAKFPRWLSVLLSILMLIAILATIVTLIVIEIVSEINKLQNKVPDFIEDYIIQIENFIMRDMVAFYDQFTAFYSSLDAEVQRNIEMQVQNFTNQLAELGNATITNIFNGILSVLGAIPTMATAFIISLLASFFISKDWKKWKGKFTNLMPDHVRRSGSAVILDLKKALFGFFKAQITLISITFVIVLIGLFILRIEYAITIAIFVGLVEILPYLGTGLIFVPWIIYSFINGDYSLVIGLSILYAIVLVQRQMMEPKILGTNVGLDPLTTLFALFVGFKLFGLLGLIIGPAAMVFISALHRAGVFRDIWTFIKGT